MLRFRLDDAIGKSLPGLFIRGRKVSPQIQSPGWNFTICRRGQSSCETITNCWVGDLINPSCVGETSSKRRHSISNVSVKYTHFKELIRPVRKQTIFSIRLYGNFVHTIFGATYFPPKLLKISESNRRHSCVTTNKPSCFIIFDNLS